MCVSGGKECLFLGKFGVLCFLETSVLRFALLYYYRRIYVAKIKKSNFYLNIPYKVLQKSLLLMKYTIHQRESAKLRGLRGLVGRVGRKFAWVTWVAWVYKILAWVEWVGVFAWVAWVHEIVLLKRHY